MMSGGRSLARAGVVVMFLNGAAIVAAFAREATIAYYYGASAELDALLVACFFVRTVTEIMPLTLGLAIIPVLAQQRERSAEYIGIMATWLLLLFGTLSVGYALAGRYLVRLISSGFDQHRAALAEHFVWLVAPVILVRGLLIPTKAFANFFRRFTLAELARVVASCAIVLTLVLLAQRWKGDALPSAFAIGSGVALILTTAALTGTGIKPGIKGGLAVFRQSAPLLGMLTVFFILLYVRQAINLFLFSQLEEGVLSSARYAASVISVPIALVGGAIATVIFPEIAVAAADGNKVRVQDVATRAVILGFLGGAVAATLLCLLNLPIIRLLFQRGRFGAEATRLTALLVVPFAVSVPLGIIWGILQRVSISVGRTWWLVASISVSLPLQAVLGWAFMRAFGALGIVTAHTICLAVTVSIVFWASRRWLEMKKALLCIAMLSCPMLAGAFFVGFCQAHMGWFLRIALAAAAVVLYIGIVRLFL
ncbi:MAG: hypothetical protein DRP82_07665, partial [Planctomycetota bacterium]